MNRGVRGEDLYTDAREHTHFLALLAETCARYDWLVGTYCLMGNHYHLLMETPLPNLPSGMRQLNGVFTQRYNKRRGRVGHLFQARYTSILVERDSHLLTLVRYVAWNPVRAGLCSCLLYTSPSPRD